MTVERLIDARLIRINTVINHASNYVNCLSSLTDDLTTGICAKT